MRKVSVILSALLLGIAFASGAAWADGETGGKIVVGVLPFSDDGKEIDAERGALAREVLLQVLARSNRIATIRRDIIDGIVAELHIDASTPVSASSAAEIGRRSGARYMLLGKVLKVGQTNKTRETGIFFARARKTTLSANAELNVKVVDVNAGRVIMDLPGYGSAREEYSKKKGIGFGFSGILGAVEKAVEVAGNVKASTMKTDSANASAVADAAFDLANRVKGQLAGEYIYVRAVQGKDNIEINADSSAGVDEGDLYLVYLDGAEKRDKNGVLNEQEKLPVAVVKVDTIHRGYSVAKSVPAGGDIGLIRKGDKTEPISAGRAGELATDKKFVKERPKEKNPSTAYDSLFGKGSAPSSLPPRSPSGNAATAPADAFPSPAPASIQAGRPLENNSTDPAKVVATYSLSSGEANTRRVAHLGARKLSGKKAYDKYVELANSYSGDYLAAYQAGEAARKLKKNDDAKAWYDKALEINPDYKPAQDARKKMK
jgi:curli biogenesis system outer membrane secretion channel CsgG